MKRLKPLLTKTGIVAAFVFFTFGLGTMEGAAQQMADMPYDLHYIDMTIIHHQDGIEMAQPHPNHLYAEKPWRSRHSPA